MLCLLVNPDAISVTLMIFVAPQDTQAVATNKAYVLHYML